MAGMRLPRLGVNIDHVATVRQARRTDEPDPVWAAVEAELGGADGITVHLREDRRHIQERDVRLLREVVAGQLNLEMAAEEGVIRVAEAVRPDEATLVPERREELTTEGGLNVAARQRDLSAVVGRLRDAGIRTSAFIEPAAEQVEAAARAGFEAVELWTGGYAHARGAAAVEAALTRLVEAAAAARERGLAVHAGHGLTYRNIGRVAALGVFEEYNIGHSIVSRALFVGIREAVREMKRLILLHSRGESQ